jgi:ATP-dependent DNA ligase
MLLKCASPFDSEDYLFEVKWDGARGIALVGTSSYRLLSRHGIDMTERFPELGFLQKLEPGTVLDGEVVVLKNGKPDFGLLLSRLGTQNKLKTRVLSRSTRATYAVFDQPYESYAPLLKKPLWERREQLSRTVEALSETGLFFSEGIRGKGKTFFEEVSGRGLEGVVAKRRESRYFPGKRSDAWLKIKPHRVMVCTVMGYVPFGTKGFRSLILASQLGGELRCVGRLSRGFDADARLRLQSLLRLRITEKAIVPSTRKGQWVEPGIYLTVSYHGLTAHGRLRFPVYERICEG